MSQGEQILLYNRANGDMLTLERAGDGSIVARDTATKERLRAACYAGDTVSTAAWNYHVHAVTIRHDGFMRVKLKVLYERNRADNL